MAVKIDALARVRASLFGPSQESEGLARLSQSGHSAAMVGAAIRNLGRIAVTNRAILRF